jgi:hypothetical protein
VVDRIKDVPEYRPKTLKGVQHIVLKKDGTRKTCKGIIDHIPEKNPPPKKRR